MDRKVIELLQIQFTGEDSVDGVERRYCVNLSPASIQNEGFVAWLDDLLLQQIDFASRVLFELPESCVSANYEAVKRFAELLRKRGAGLSLDHFGLGARAFNYLQSMPLDCLKVDQSFVHHLNDKADNQFFLRSLVQISRTCDVEIFAEGVETEAEWAQVVDLGLSGGQGYYLSEPGLELLE
jgi:EAL domain-containing protein (putative c-di-GMP-specific phosphodiesterase class I)